MAVWAVDPRGAGTRPGRRLALGAIAVLLAVSACSGGDNADAAATQDPAWSANIALLKERAKTSFVRDILDDHMITTAEHAEAAGRTRACLDDGGIPTTHHTNPWTGVPDYGPESMPGSTAAERQALWDTVLYCTDQWDGGVVLLFEAMQENPDELDYFARVFACLKSHELIPSGFALADLEAFLTRPEFCPLPSTLDEGRANPCFSRVWINTEEDSAALGIDITGSIGVEQNPDYVMPPMVLPNGVSLDDGQGAVCMAL